jgi:high-affinity Fe2+/Pb2+ permease
LKTYIYISGVLSAFLLTGWLAAFFMNLENHYYFLISGIVLFFLVFLPLVMVNRRQHRERMEEIIRNYKLRKEQETDLKSAGKRAEGWNMNNSPFRERRSGLQWGGGNIHAAEASRGKRRSFRSR